MPTVYSSVPVSGEILTDFYVYSLSKNDGGKNSRENVENAQSKTRRSLAPKIRYRRNSFV